MIQQEPLSKKNKIILYILAGIGALAIILVGIFAVIRMQEQRAPKETDRDIIAGYSWYDPKGLGYWDFSDGHIIRVYVREDTDKPFVQTMELVYMLNEEYHMMQISSDLAFSDGLLYNYELIENHLLLYNQAYAVEGEKQLPTLIFERGEIEE